MAFGTKLQLPQITRRVSGVTKSSFAERQISVNRPLVPEALDERGDPKLAYPSNEVVTSKYSLVSFLPKNLFEQFRRLANIFFLVLIVLQLFPQFTTVDPFIAALPTIIIVLATGVKDGFEDLKRHNTDNQVNNRNVYTLSHTGWENVNYSTIGGRRPWWRVDLSIRAWIIAVQSRRGSGKGPVLPVATTPPLSTAGSPVKGGVAIELRETARNSGGSKSKDGSTSSHDRKESVASEAADDAMVTVKLRGDESEMHPTTHMDGDDDATPPTDPADPSAALAAGNDPTQFMDPWAPTKWRDLRVGDFVFLRNNEFIPADVVIVSTSEPDSVCYIETKNLDGETNLKVHKGMPETAHVRTPRDCQDLHMVVACEVPNNSMFTFRGSVVLERLGPHAPADGIDAGLPRKVPLSMNGVLLRGCVLRNTAWVIGVAAYTGSQTKLQLNSGETPSKRSIIEKNMNPQIMINLAIMAIICIVCAVAGIFWARSFGGTLPPYLPRDDSGSYDAGYEAFIAFWSALIAFQNIVPISLYLTVEIVKTLQAYFIYSDLQLYYEELDLPCVPKSWTLADDLGQIEYVFSDKTGTLTRNVMEFRRCSINGVAYGAPLVTSSSPTAAGGYSQAAQFALPETYAPRSQYGAPQPKFYDALLWQDMDEDNEHARIVSEFWRLIGICHTVLVSKPDPAKPFAITYKAQSPDEAALVDTGKDVGFTFIGRHMTDIFLDVMGVEEQYTLLAVLEFNSTRKRMSIVARRPDGAIVLYCKGADSVIFERLTPDTNPIVREVTLQHLEIFADEGLRTLCLAYRIIPPDEFLEWIELYNDACTTLDGREELIDAAAERIEQNLNLLGATAIEDRLQDGVPECIQTLRDAGIKIWVLTGDKVETAVSIGYSCNLLSKSLNLIMIRGGPEDPAAVMNQIKQALDTFFIRTTQAAEHGKGQLRGEDDDVDTEHMVNTICDHALVIEGSALKVALEESNKGVLLNLGSRCKVVVCCRVSPLQKAQVVSMVKHGLNTVTLAIGDGANDVSMIQAAHIGIGIAGEEGLQAVMASDYAIAQFKYLSRLLLVHGRWSYHRISELIFNYFYKDIIFVLVIFVFQFWAGYSTQAPYEFSYMLFYNLFFTNWPVMVMGIFDQDLSENMAQKVPKLYMSGIKQTLYTPQRFWMYMTDGLYQALVCYFIPYGIYWNSTASTPGGGPPSIYEMGTTMAVASIVSANLYVALNTRTWTWLNHVAQWIATFGVLFAYLAVYMRLPDSSIYGLGDVLMRSAPFYFGVVLSVVLCLLPRYVGRYIRQTLFPRDVDIAMEVEKYGLDETPLLPERAVVMEPLPPPSAHPDRLSLTIPSPRQMGTVSLSQQMLEVASTPQIMQFAHDYLGMTTPIGTTPLNSLDAAVPTGGDGGRDDQSGDIELPDRDGDDRSSSKGGTNDDMSRVPSVASSDHQNGGATAGAGAASAGSVGSTFKPTSSASIMTPASGPMQSSAASSAGGGGASTRVSLLELPGPETSGGSGAGTSVVVYPNPSHARTKSGLQISIGGSSVAGSGAVGASGPRGSTGAAINRPNHRRSVTLSGSFAGGPGSVAGGVAGGNGSGGMSPRLGPTSHVTQMQTMLVTRNRGFSFSTDEGGGMRNILMCEFTPSTPRSPTDLGMSMQAQRIVKEQAKSTASDWALYSGYAGSAATSPAIASIGAFSGTAAATTAASGLGSAVAPLDATTVAVAAGAARRKFALGLQTLPSQHTLQRDSPPLSAPATDPRPLSFAGAVPLRSPTVASDAGPSAVLGVAVPPRVRDAGRGHMRAHSTGQMVTRADATLGMQYGLAVDAGTGRVISVGQTAAAATATGGGAPTPSSRTSSPLAISTTTAAPSPVILGGTPLSPIASSPTGSASGTAIPTLTTTTTSPRSPLSPGTSPGGSDRVRTPRPMSALRHTVATNEDDEDDDDEEAAAFSDAVQESIAASLPTVTITPGTPASSIPPP
ncbi:hypothetical protein BC828DRAFT_373386 [Blastocladiella britannica]|nr:hypothetical protein BC828DRAFT_373386 [Blastocladiella britannica]